MSDQYRHPDDPDVFARVLEHFRNTPVAYWEAQLDNYARQARAQKKADKAAGIASAPLKKRKPKVTGETNGCAGTHATQTSCMEDTTSKAE